MEQDLHDDYAAAGFGAAVGAGSAPCLLLVDFVRAYTDPASPIYADVDSARLCCIDLLTRARARGVMVAHTRVEFMPGGLDGGWFYRKIPSLRVFDRGSPHAWFAAGLEPASGEVVIVKQYASAFFGTSLAATLRASRIDTVVIGGLSTSGCVRASAVDAMQHGFRTIVVRDGVADRDPRPHEANLFDLAAKYADVVAASQLTGIFGPPP